MASIDNAETTFPNPDSEAESLSNSKVLSETKQIYDTITQFIKGINKEDFKTDAWKTKLVQMAVSAYNKNGRAAYFQQKYPGLPPDELADILISMHSKWAMVFGAGVGGAGSLIPLAFLPVQIITDLVGLGYIQLKLILDLMLIYDVKFDTQDPEDTMHLLYYVFPVAISDSGSPVVASIGARLTQQTVWNKISGQTSKRLIKTSKKLVGKSIGKTKIAGYASGGVGAALGATINYFSTRGLGQVAKADFRRGITKLNALLPRENPAGTDSNYPIIFPAVLKYIALIDGVFTKEEKNLYKAVLGRISFDEHTPEEFEKFMRSDNIHDAIREIKNKDLQTILFEVAQLMAVIDGELHEKEKMFLSTTAEMFGLPIDPQELEKQAVDYRTIQ